MAIFGTMSITNAGQALYTKSQAGKPIIFTKLSIGSGQVYTQNTATLTDLVLTKFDVLIPLISLNTLKKSAAISGAISNIDMPVTTYICEVGLWATDPDVGLILYGYASAGTHGDYMASAFQGAYSWIYQVNVAIGNDSIYVTSNISNFLYDYVMLRTYTTFTVINGGNRKVINNSIADVHNVLAIRKVEKYDLYINVQDYGAKGDGITDDTIAIQTAINDTPSPGVLFFPRTNYSYNFTNLVIPSNKSDLKILGSGLVNSWLKSTALIPFSVQVNGFNIDSIRIQGPGIFVVGSILFKDDRVLNTADFDMNVKNSYIAETETVVKTKGHGVSFESTFFYDIRSYIIDAGFPDISVYVPGSSNNGLFTTSFRGFTFKNNTVHFSPCMILKNTGTNAKNLMGVIISGNQLQGSSGYIEGYVRNCQVSNNIHYQCGNVRKALFMLNGCDNLNIELNVSGTKLEVEGLDTYCNEIIDSDGVCNNLTIKGNIQDVYKDCFLFRAGGKGIKIDVNANNISIGGNYSLVNLSVPTSVYDGIVVNGVVTSPNTDFLAVKRDYNLVRNYNINLEVIGDFQRYDNLDPAESGTRRPVTGIYSGDGTTSQHIIVKFKAALIQISSNNYFVMSSVISHEVAPDITITDAGFTIRGTANTSGTLYSFRAQ
ncbi:glycoside hydrolase family 55 protein [Clostridium algoriphilum]|uniref:glycoside hydrolase family 55 protein n=1 Tax=Clostridium algoriphilum TaxID=198347 RepID=UPI001CF161AB|nr:glycoside hydrolase family 55 protein [Clostridium algoriphilum]MCB2294553.1 glycoside hydrolase family 55 protein [Clostridium algoriphilum]